MAVRSDRLYIGAVTGAAAYQTVYTCPSDRRTIVKEITVFLATVSGLTNIRVFDGTNQGVIDSRTPAGNAFYRAAPELFAVLRAGDELQVLVPVGAVGVFYISGAELDLTP